MGSLMIASVNDFFGSYLRHNKLSQFELMILGRDINTQDQINDDGKISYRSNFEHVNFVSGISPSTYVEQYAYGLNMTEFLSAYEHQLTTPEAMMNLCCIVDLVVNKDVNVIFLCSEREFKMGFVDPLREFIFNMFGLYMVTSIECMYDPGLLTSYGDKNDIRRKLNYQIKEHELVDKGLGKFINRFCDDIEKSYRETLMSKSIDELYQYGLKYSIHVNKYKPKEYIVDRIMARVLRK